MPDIHYSPYFYTPFVSQFYYFLRALPFPLGDAPLRFSRIADIGVAMMSPADFFRHAPQKANLTAIWVLES